MPPTPQFGWRNSAAGIGVSHIQKPFEKSQTGKYIGAAIAIFSARQGSVPSPKPEVRRF